MIFFQKEEEDKVNRSIFRLNLVTENFSKKKKIKRNFCGDIVFNLY